MAMKISVEGNKVIGTHNGSGEQTLLAVCDDAAKAAELMERGWAFNDKRQYTKAARTFAAAEALPGFAWAPYKEIE